MTADSDTGRGVEAGWSSGALWLSGGAPGERPSTMKMRLPSYSSRWAYGAFLFYLLVVAAGAIISFHKDKGVLMEAVDRELMIGASSIRYILPDDFHDRALDAHSISTDEDERNIGALSRFIEGARFAFVYTMIESGGGIYVTSSSASKEELESGTEVRYFAPYEEARPYFKDSEPLFTTYTDRWGHFRAALIPQKSPDGRTYIAAAEFDIGYVDALLRRRLVDILFFSLALLLAAVPLFVALDKELLNANVRLEKGIEQRTRELKRLVTIDDLTGQLNRKELYRLLGQELERHAAQGTCCCLAVLDLDHFKSINDAWGHPAGDAVLRATATTIAAVLRGTDILGRIGGEEFAVILGDTELDQALDMAERIRSRVQGSRVNLTGGQAVGLTISIGVASIREANGDLATLVKLADQRLYRAKEHGRNRVV